MNEAFIENAVKSAIANTEPAASAAHEEVYAGIPRRERYWTPERYAGGQDQHEQSAAREAWMNMREQHIRNVYGNRNAVDHRHGFPRGMDQNGGAAPAFEIVDEIRPRENSQEIRAIANDLRDGQMSQEAKQHFASVLNQGGITELRRLTTQINNELMRMTNGHGAQSQLRLIFGQERDPYGQDRYFSVKLMNHRNPNPLDQVIFKAR